MFLAKIEVVLKESVLDPQGVTIQHAAHDLGYMTVSDIRVGKYFEVKIHEDVEKNAKQSADTLCDKLLANPVIESYRITLERLA